MFSRPASHVVKALLLGFFCCLGSVSAEDGEKPTKVELLTLNEVRPNSEDLILKIETGDAEIPPGYQLCEFPVIDEKTKKKTGSTKLLVSKQPIVTGTDVEFARQSGAVDEITIRLTEEGGKRVAQATKKMNLGRDRMAVVVRGNGLISPTVQAVLGRDFVINGLDGKVEVERLVKALNAAQKGN